MNIIEKEGKKYLIIGEKAIEIIDIQGGIPKIKTVSEEIQREDGSIDVVVKVPFLKIDSKKEQEVK